MRCPPVAVNALPEVELHTQVVHRLRVTLRATTETTCLPEATECVTLSALVRELQILGLYIKKPWKHPEAPAGLLRSRTGRRIARQLRFRHPGTASCRWGGVFTCGRPI